VTAAALARTTGAELRRAAGEARGAWSPAAWVAAVALAIGLLVPFLGLGLRMDALASTVYLAVAATGLGLTVGAAGLPSLGAGAFVAIGAFTSALLMARAGWPLEPAALCGALAALAAGLISGGVVRLRPAFVAVSTWLLAWLVWLFLFAFPSVSGGSQGLIVPERTLLGLSATPTVHYEAALVLLVLSLLAIAAVRRGAFGLELSALRQHPPLATSLGVPLARRRLGAFAASAAIAGLAGGLSVQLAAVADPAAYDPFLSFKLLVAVLLGGAAATLGPAVGVAALGLIGLVSDPLARLLQLPLERFDTAVAAFLLLFVLALGGDGIIPWLSPWLPRFRRTRPPVTPRQGGRSGTRAALKVEGLTKAFGGVVALDGLSLELAPGETAALVGPNGSGKTTALRLISGAMQPDGGRVLFGGRDLTEAPTRERVRLGVARTLQTTSAFTELTALEEPVARAAALNALALVGLEQQADVPIPELTSSQRRLVGLASALATEPHVLLVDEPAAGVGAEELEPLARVLAEIGRQGVAVLLVEHNLRLVRMAAERMIVLAAGEVVAEGTVAEVGESELVRQAYLGAQRL